VIVVVGQPLYRANDDGVSVDGLPARIALAAAAGGRAVQLVGKAGEDPEGDAVALALAEGGVGHVALLRDAGGPTLRAPEPAGVELDAAEDIDEPVVVDRSPDPPPGATALDAADVDLALRYLTDYAVLVLADQAEPDVVKVVADAAAWVGARLILVLWFGHGIPERLPADVIVFEAPDADPDGVFASFVGSFAAALDDGGDPADAFRSSIEADGWAASASA
jgi:sugar/nucleoside kinase (ribokinase family)